MQQQFSSSENSTPSGNLSESNSMVQAKIDSYLTRTCASLFLALPEEEALEQRREMKSHLECLIAAYVELGSSESLAVTQALEQFGKEQSVAQAWKQECETTKVEAGRGTFWSVIRPVVGCSLINWLLLPIALEVYAYITNGYYWTGKALPGALMMVVFLVFAAEYALFPGFLGFLAGRRARGKVLVASVATLPGIQLGCLLLSALIYRSVHVDVFPPHGINALLGGSIGSFCITFAGFGALGAVLARAKKRRALRLAGHR